MLVYIDMDDVLCDFSGAQERALEVNPGIQFPQSQYGFYTDLLPIDGAVESVKYLIKSEKFDPYILTAPSVRNPLSYTEKRVWVEKYFGLEFVERLIICSNKGLLRGDALVDDRLDGRGQEGFTGEVIHFGSPKFPDWNSAMRGLKSMAE